MTPATDPLEPVPGMPENSVPKLRLAARMGPFLVVGLAGVIGPLVGAFIVAPMEASPAAKSAADAILAIPHSSERTEIQNWLDKSDKVRFVSYLSDDKDAIPSHVMVRDNSENLHECDILTYSNKDGSHAAASLYCGLNDNTPSFTIPLSSIPKQ